MLEILKTRLPEGLEIVKVYDRTGASQLKIRFAYKGLERMGYLYKTCPPGEAENNCDFVIQTMMMTFAMDMGDLAAAKYWANKQMAQTQRM